MTVPKPFVKMSWGAFLGALLGVLAATGFTAWGAAKVAIDSCVTAVARRDIEQLKSAAEADASAIRGLRMAMSHDIVKLAKTVDIDLGASPPSSDYYSDHSFSLDEDTAPGSAIFWVADPAVDGMFPYVRAALRTGSQREVIADVYVRRYEGQKQLSGKVRIHFYVISPLNRRAVAAPADAVMKAK